MTKTIDWDEAMNQVGGDRDFLDEVLQDLLNEAATADDEIGAGIARGDYEAIEKAAHRIKGSASYLCCDKLKDISLELQDAGRKAKDGKGNIGLKDIEPMYDTFQECLKELRKEVANHK